MYEVLISNEAEKNYKKQDKGTKRRLNKCIDDLIREQRRYLQIRATDRRGITLIHLLSISFLRIMCQNSGRLLRIFLKTM